MSHLVGILHITFNFTEHKLTLQ